MQVIMKIIDIYNLPRQSSYDVESVLRLKDWGRSIFPAQNTMGVNWALLKKNVPGLQAFFVETELNKFFTISLNNEKFILVNYDKVIENLSTQIAMQAQQIAILQTVLQQLVPAEETADTDVVENIETPE